MLIHNFKNSQPFQNMVAVVEQSAKNTQVLMFVFAGPFVDREGKQLDEYWGYSWPELTTL